MTYIRSHKGVHPEFGDRVWIDPSAVVIGDVVLGEDCSVWPMTTIRGDMHQIRIGSAAVFRTAASVTLPTPAPITPMAGL